jgi:hypothetical protein
MRSAISVGVGVLLLSTVVCVLAQQPPAAGGEAKVRIGVYDSRAVAIAWAGSSSFKEWDASFRAEYAKAKTDGDPAKIGELEKEAVARQQQMHMQGFSTAPVDNILDSIKGSLVGIQEEAGVTALVSKWDTAGLAKYAGAEQVDVTMKLVDALQPTEQQRRFACEALKSEPIPLDEAAKIKDW